MTRKKKDRYLEGLQRRREEAARQQAEDGLTGEAGESEKPEDKVLTERAPFLWPAKKRRPQWK